MVIETLKEYGYIKDIDEDLQVVAVQNSNCIGSFLAYGITPSKKVQIEAAKNDEEFVREMLLYESVPCEEAQIIAVKQNIYSLNRLLRNQFKLGYTVSEKVKLTALNKNGYAIQFFPKPTEEEITIALKTSPEAFHSIPDQFKTKKVIELYNKLRGNLSP